MLKPSKTSLYLIACAALPLCAFADPITKDDWPQWRGARHDGIADPDQKLPTEFSAAKNVHWVAPIPGRGHGSPIVVGTRVFIATADEKEKTQSLLCLDRESGRTLWTQVVHSGGFPAKSNKKASQASSTPACDGQRVFINFENAGAVHTTAFDLDGNKLWQQKISDYVIHQGFSTSPAIYRSLVLVSADNKTGGAICGLKRTDGSVVWRIDRPKKPNYITPIVHRIGGRDQVILQGCDLVTSVDPLTGRKLWEVEGSTTECVSSIVSDGERVFTSGGYPRNHVAAMKADGSGTVEWENISRVYVTSMLLHGGYLFAIMDNGNAMCWNAESGERLWKERLNRTTSSSPVMAGDRIYAADETGQFSVISADPMNFEILAQNKLGDEVFATPTICGNRIYARVAENADGRRQEKLYCIGEE